MTSHNTTPRLPQSEIETEEDLFESLIGLTDSQESTFAGPP